jgi:hypothetical protein
MFCTQSVNLTSHHSLPLRSLTLFTARRLTAHSHNDVLWQLCQCSDWTQPDKCRSIPDRGSDTWIYLVTSTFRPTHPHIRWVKRPERHTSISPPSSVAITLPWCSALISSQLFVLPAVTSHLSILQHGRLKCLVLLSTPTAIISSDTISMFVLVTKTRCFLWGMNLFSYYSVLRCEAVQFGKQMLVVCRILLLLF